MFLKFFISNVLIGDKKLLGKKGLPWLYFTVVKAES
jgi:hypothetical protein